MKILAMYGYELVTVLLPCLLVLAVFSRRHKRDGLCPPKTHVLWVLLFTLYIFAVLRVTGAGTLYALQRLGLEIHSGQLNLIPFSEGGWSGGHSMNVVLFVPFGFLLPMAWPRMGHIWATVPMGLAFSLLIELSQLLNHRITDVDDLITNTLGALVGYGLYEIVALVAKPKPNLAVYRASEPVWYLGAMFAGHFLLFNEMGLARVLYGF